VDQRMLLDWVLIYFYWTDCYFQVSVFVFGDGSLKCSGYRLMTELRVWWFGIGCRWRSWFTHP